METIILTLDKIVTSMPQFGIAFLLLLLGKVFYDRTTSYQFNDELTTKDNPAFGVCLAGYLIGLSLAMSGALFGTGWSLKENLLTVLVGGLAALLLMRLSVFINDKLILYKFSIDKEMIQDRNLGTGFVVAGSCLATGFMLNGVLTGESSSFLLGIRDIAVYFVFGQLVLVVGGLVFQAITKYDLYKIIEQDNNIPAGISFGGFLTALGIIVRASLAGATSNFAEELTIMVIISAVGLSLLVIARVIADKVFLPASPLSKEVAVDKNPAAGAIAAACFICIAVLLSSAIRPNEMVYESTVEESVMEIPIENEQVTIGKAVKGEK